MSSGASPAFALLRIPRGDPRPTGAAFLEALRQDREQLHLPDLTGQTEIEVAGPYAITVDGSEVDEYVVWER